MGRVPPVQRLINSRLSGWLILLIAATLTQLSLAQQFNTTSEFTQLDVGIRLFDPNIPEDWREKERKEIFPEVRKAEATLFPYLLRNTLEESGEWGVVRVVPRQSDTFSLNIHGKILLSTGERLSLRIAAVDAAGRRWFQKTYKLKVGLYGYEEKQLAKQDPFQLIYERIASDLVLHRNRQSDKKLKQLDAISRIRFAQSLSPEAFDGYTKQRNGRIRLVRMVADNDAHYARIEDIRKREHLFIDTLDARYRDFSADIQASYGSWRKEIYKETLARREQRRKSIAEGILGVLAVVGGIAAQDSSSRAGRRVGDVGILAGAAMIGSSVNAGNQAQMHTEGIREISETFDAEAGEQVLEMEDMTITLVGTVDEQYAQLKDVLKNIYTQETGDY